MIRRIHQFLERNILLFGMTVLIVSLIGGLAQIVPIAFDKKFKEPAENLKPYTALELAGRDIYIREGCALCHSQQIRPLLGETIRYGRNSRLNDSVYDYPFLWGSKRTGPDLSRLYGKYSENWQRIHLTAPTKVVPDSIMPAYPWLEVNDLQNSIPDIEARMNTLRILGVPYTDEEIKNAPSEIKDKTELDAVVAYLMSLGRFITEQNTIEAQQ
ncbi:MAG: cytochrome-c oxidase, cbb3-type subunit II [Methylacidiphilales bacterium]|nr:cytochrome-c oxidase, cbb3-type subunit II [Candidatus Methylacidiphilales bacterium]